MSERSERIIITARFAHWCAIELASVDIPPGSVGHR